MIKKVIKILIVVLLVIVLIVILCRTINKPINDDSIASLYDEETGLYYIEDQNTRWDNYGKWKWRRLENL